MSGVLAARLTAPPPLPLILQGFGRIGRLVSGRAAVLRPAGHGWRSAHGHRGGPRARAQACGPPIAPDLGGVGAQARVRR